MTEEQQRDLILDEAVTWLGTPWHHEARVKNAGVDCAQLLIAVYAAAGLIEPIELEHYPQDWHLHREEAKFIGELLKHCRKVDAPLPGDIMMFKYGRHDAHGGIYMGNARVLHAFRDDCRVTITELHHSPITERIAGFYRWNGFA